MCFLRDRRVASYKLPERLEIMPTLPVTSGGKLARATLAHDLALKLGNGHAGSAAVGDWRTPNELV